MPRFNDLSTSAAWHSHDEPIGDFFDVTYAASDFNNSTNPSFQVSKDVFGTYTVGDYTTDTTGTSYPWDNNSNNNSTNSTSTSPSPFGNPSTPPWTTPSTPSTPSVPFIHIATEDVESEGKHVIKAPPVSLEQILVEIAKVLRDRGDILEVREIFERYKLRLIDHDGEVIFDPAEDKDLEERGF